MFQSGDFLSIWYIVLIMYIFRDVILLWSVDKLHPIRSSTTDEDLERVLGMTIRNHGP